MHNVALLIGGNQGDRHALIEQATEQIRQRIGSVVALSRVYETEPWGEFEMESGERRVENFLNRALLVETPLTAHEVLREALAIEADLGRQRAPMAPKGPNGLKVLNAPNAPNACLYHSRPMDIDLIFYGDEVVDTPELQIPHPRMHLRRFVLEPLCEIIPDYCHPLLHKTIREMLEGGPE